MSVAINTVTDNDLICYNAKKILAESSEICKAIERKIDGCVDPDRPMDYLPGTIEQAAQIIHEALTQLKLLLEVRADSLAGR